MTSSVEDGEYLTLCARYAALAAEQESALDTEDFDRFREVADERDRIRKEIRAASRVARDGQKQARLLAPALEIERRMHAKLRVFRRDTVRDLRELGRGAGRQREYTRALREGRRGGDLDVRY